jgi:glyoxylase-like metal-dependent hydrolase (beta-lactamase superfamily II)
VLYGITAIFLPGHARGHTGYAFGDDLLHAGDSFYDGAAITGNPDRLLKVFERGAAALPKHIPGNHERLAALARDHGVDVFCTHDPVAFARLNA